MHAPISTVTVLTVTAAFLLAVGLASVTPAAAQTRERPPNLQPVPEPPPPPKGFELDSTLDPQVTIVKRGGETVEAAPEEELEGKDAIIEKGIEIIIEESKKKKA